MGRLEETLAPKSVHEVSTEISVRRKSLISNEKSVGWPMGLEPTTTGITILDSTN